jgi:hypothetical protein
MHCLKDSRLVLDISLYMTTLFVTCVFVKTFYSKWLYTYIFVITKSGHYEEEIMGVLPGHQTSNFPTVSRRLHVTVLSSTCSVARPAVEYVAVNVQPGAVRPYGRTRV